MDSKSRAALQPLWSKLPPPFSGEVYDDFVNATWRGLEGLRVMRIVGKSRCIVLFEYDANLMSVDRVWRHPSREREEYSLHYLHSDGSFQKFDTRAIEAEWRGSASRAIEAEWRASASKRSTYSWERDLHHWLVEHGAKTFVGAGWVDRISEEISNLLPRWRNELSGWPRE